MLDLTLQLLLRSAVILGAARGISSLPGLSSGARHKALLAGFAMLLLWPLSSALLPEVSVLIGPDASAVSSVTVQQHLLSTGARSAAWIRLWPVWLWLAGVALSLARLCVGYARACSIARGGTAVRDPSWMAAVSGLSRTLNLKQTPAVYISTEASTPFALGVFRPRLVLPNEAQTWTDIRQRSVLVHEFAHLKRNDPASQLLSAVVASVWWFQPLVWFNQIAMRRNSELACDHAVIEFGIEPLTYADELLQIARSFRSSHPCMSGVTPFVRPSELDARLRSILEPRQRWRRNVSAVAIASVAAAAFTASAVTFRSNQQQNKGAGSMNRTVLASMLLTAGLSAATVDQTSHAKAIHVDPLFEQAKIVKKVPPVYPAGAKAAGITGEVKLEAVISKEGAPIDLRVLSTPSDDLAQSALDAVHQWRWSSTLLNGQPVDVTTEITITYSLTK